MIYALYTALLEHFYGRLSYILDETRSTLPGAPPLANSFQLYLN